MQPLHIQLSLFSQYLKKATAKELFSEASIAQANGERIFGLRIPYLLDDISIKSNKSFTSINTALGYYQWEYDLLTLITNELKPCLRNIMSTINNFLHSVFVMK